MVRYLKHNNIDRVKWDDCISSSSNGIIYAYSWYLDIVCENWGAIVNEDYSTVMPLTTGRKYYMDYIYPPFFTQQLGVFSKNIISEELCLQFLSSIPSACRYIEMNLHVSNKWVPDSFSVRKFTDCILDLNKPYSEVVKNYSENHTRNISKATKQGLKITKHTNAGIVIEMFRQNRGKFISNLKQPQYEMFANLVKEAHSRNMVEIWFVNLPDGTPCASAVFFESHDSAIFIFSAVTQEGRANSAMHLLVDRFINEKCQKLKTLDFEGSNNPELARFYKGFGSKEFLYLQIHKNQLPPPWSWFKN